MGRAPSVTLARATSPAGAGKERRGGGCDGVEVVLGESVCCLHGGNCRRRRVRLKRGVGYRWDFAHRCGKCGGDWRTKWVISFGDAELSMDLYHPHSSLHPLEPVVLWACVCPADAESSVPGAEAGWVCVSGAAGVGETRWASFCRREQLFDSRGDRGRVTRLGRRFHRVDLGSV